MTKTNLFFTLLFLFYIQVTAQFSLQKFIDEPINSTLDEMKQNLSDKKLIEDQQKSYRFLSYFDWLDPVSIKIAYLFNEDGKLIGKTLSHAKSGEQEAKNLLDILYNTLVKKFGESLNKHTLMGITASAWYGKGGSVITLTQKSDKTILMIMKM